MHLLVVGGSRMIGRHAALAAVVHGHRVTVFNRGITAPAPTGTRLIQGDRNDDADLERLAAAGPYDAVIDSSAYYPQQVNGLFDALAGVGGRLVGTRYVLVSSISVYGGDDPPIPAGVTEDGQVLPPVHPDTLPDSPWEHYGGLKVACEQVAAERAAHLVAVRAGSVIGPDDYTGRFAYWVKRLREGGRVLCPGRPDRAVSTIDARDLGRWMVALAADGPDLTVHGIAPARPFHQLLEQVGDAVGFDGELVWVDDEPLLAAGVQEWSDLPMWLARPRAGMMQASAERAVTAGLHERPIGETAADTLAWLQSDPTATVAGMDREREADLLTRLAP